jgi:hypothetical protein
MIAIVPHHSFFEGLTELTAGMGTGAAAFRYLRIAAATMPPPGPGMGWEYAWLHNFFQTAFDLKVDRTNGNGNSDATTK